MKHITKTIACIVMTAVLMSAMVLTAFATGIRRPISGTENLIPTTAPSSGTTGSGIFQRPIRGEESLVPTTEAFSGSTGSGTIQRPIRGEENLIPTTEPTSGSSGSGMPNRPIRGEENLIPTTPSPEPDGVMTKPTTSDTASSGTSATKPTESTQKPEESISESPYFIKHPTSENVKAGANAQFVAIAENADGYSWIILSADGRDTYTIAEACRHFKGLKAEGSITTRLTLFYIPASLHGHYVACIAEGNGETVTSNGALVTVQEHNAAAQTEETKSATVPATEASTESAAETTAAVTAPETAPVVTTENTEEAEVAVPAATEHVGKQEEKKPAGLYFIGGICVALLLTAIVLLCVLLKTLQKGRHR